MNAQALIRDRYSLSDLEQLVQFVEQMLSVYTEAIVALLLLVVVALACRVIFERKQRLTPERVAPASSRKDAARELKDRPLHGTGFESLSLDQSSAY